MRLRSSGTKSSSSSNSPPPADISKTPPPQQAIGKAPTRPRPAAGARGALAAFVADISFLDLLLLAVILLYLWLCPYNKVRLGREEGGGKKRGWRERGKQNRHVQSFVLYLEMCLPPILPPVVRLLSSSLAAIQVPSSRPFSIPTNVPSFFSTT